MYARQAIQAKFLAPTNFRPARIKAWCQARKMIFAWDQSLGVCENHRRAAVALAKLLGWPTKGAGFGELPDGGFVMIFPIR